MTDQYTHRIGTLRGIPNVAAHAPRQKNHKTLQGLHEGKRIVVKIDDMDIEGRGCGVWSDTNFLDSDEIDIAVRGAFPGDTALVQIERVFPARKLAAAKMISLQQIGSLHAPTVGKSARSCVHKQPCPACPLHTLSRDAMATFKQERLRQALFDADPTFLEKLDLEKRLHPTKMPASLWGRRQKVKLIVGGTATQHRLGLYAPHSHDVYAAHLCPHTHPALGLVAEQFLAALDREKVEPNAIQAIILRVFAEGVGAVVVVPESLPESLWHSLQSLVEINPLRGTHTSLRSLTERRHNTGNHHTDPNQNNHSANSLVTGETTRIYGPRLLTPIHGGPPAETDAFCQADAVLAEELYDAAAAFVCMDHPSESMMIDAYAGTGGFSRALQKQGCPAQNIVAVENAPWCQEPLRELGVHLVQKPVEKSFDDLAQLAEQSQKKYGGIVVDPPRKGLGAAAVGIANLGATRIALVSCAPEAMARDAIALKKAGYQLHALIPYDLFAGSAEVEALSLWTLAPR